MRCWQLGQLSPYPAIDDGSQFQSVSVSQSFGNSGLRPTCTQNPTNIQRVMDWGFEINQTNITLGPGSLMTYFDFIPSNIRVPLYNWDRERAA